MAFKDKYDMMLQISTSLKQFNALRSNSLTFFNLREHRGIVFKSGNKATILSDILADGKNYQYAIQPYLDS